MDFRGAAAAPPHHLSRLGRSCRSAQRTHHLLNFSSFPGTRDGCGPVHGRSTRNGLWQPRLPPTEREVQMKMRVLFVLCAALALTVGVATATAGNGHGKGKGGNSAAAHACQHGGWKTLFRSDFTPFKNQGACVSYAAHGGTLTTKTQSQLDCEAAGGTFTTGGLDPTSLPIAWSCGPLALDSRCPGHVDHRLSGRRTFVARLLLRSATLRVLPLDVSGWLGAAVAPPPTPHQPSRAS